MRLEVISRLPTGSAKPTPLVFVHGAFAGAWVWEAHFLPFFAEHGYAAHAVSLRGHGDSEGEEVLPFARLADYADDVARVAANLPEPPVLIGHSLGGGVAQRYAAHAPVAGLVLLASAPPHGLFGCWLNMLLNHPRLLHQMSLLQMFGPAAGIDLDLVRRGLFSDDTPASAVARILPRMARESPLAVLDLWGFGLPPVVRRPDLPVLVLGAERDPFVHPGAVMATAWAWRTTAEIFPDMAHALMLDHHWRRPAMRILDWLETEGVDAARPARGAAAAA
jgi:pimeloyl-ACP methyl ester carboxylesterase